MRATDILARLVYADFEFERYEFHDLRTVKDGPLSRDKHRGGRVRAGRGLRARSIKPFETETLAEIDWGRRRYLAGLTLTASESEPQIGDGLRLNVGGW